MRDDQQRSGAHDDAVVLPPVAADPLFTDAVDEAVAGPVEDMPDAQPTRVVGSSPADFASLYIRHRSSFALHASRFLRDARDIDEVLQEAFLRLFLAIPELETELQALAYCRRTVTNLCIDRYRADQRRPRLVDLDETASDLYDEASFDDPVLRAEDAAIVRQALALLTPLHRAALVKREIEEKPLPQIAVELDIPEESVKHVLHRARRAMRRLLVGTSVEPGVDLDTLESAEIYEIARGRVARAVTDSAKSLLLVFVSVLTVVGGWRATSVTSVPDGGPVSQVPSGSSVAPDDLRVPHARTSSMPHAHAPAASHHASTPRTSHAQPQAPARPLPTLAGAPRPVVVTPAHPAVPPVHTPPTTQPPVVQPPVTQPPVTKVTGFSISAPLLQAAGAAAVETKTVQLLPTGEWSNDSRFVAATAYGEFALDQSVQRSTEGVISANVAPTVPLPTTTVTDAQTSTVTTASNGDGTVNVHVELGLAPDGADPAVSAIESPASSITVIVDAVYSEDVTRVLAESVTVAGGGDECQSPSDTTGQPSDIARSGCSDQDSAGAPARPRGVPVVPAEISVPVSPREQSVVTSG